MAKKFAIKENGDFKVISKRYVLYGRISGRTAYVHFENAYHVAYEIHDFPTRDIMNLVRGKITWNQFACLVEQAYWWPYCVPPV